MKVHRVDMERRNFTFSGSDLAKLEELLTGGGGSAIGESRAMRTWAVWAAVTLIADSIAQLPLRLVQIDRTSGNSSARPTHPLSRLMRQPSPYLSGFQFWRTMIMQLVGWGNAYAVIVGRAATATELLFVPSLMVSPRNRIDEDYQIVDPLGDRALTIPASDMIHVQGYSPDGVNGWSPIRMHRDAVDVAQKQGRYLAQYMERGAKISAVLEADVPLDQEIVDELRTRFRETYAAGGSDEGATAILDSGLKYKPMTVVSPTDAEYVDGRKLNATEIFSIFRVPPILGGLMEAATLNNAEQLFFFFLRSTLAPYMTAVESELGRKLLSRLERRRFGFDFDPQGFLRVMQKDRFDSFRVAIIGGWMTPNEARAQENLEPKDGGDDLWRPMNVTAADEAGDEPQPAPTGAGPPDPSGDQTPRGLPVYRVETGTWLAE